MSVSAMYVSDSYRTISTPLTDSSLFLQTTVRVGVTTPTLGTLSGGVTVSVLRDGSLQTTFVTAYSRQIIGSLQFIAIVQGTGWPPSHVTGFAGLTLPLGSTVAQARYFNVDGLSNASMEIGHSISQGTGLGYDFAGQLAQGSASAWDASGNAQLEYHGTRGIYSALGAYDLGQEQFSGSLSAAGSLLWIPGGLFLTRPIRDGFTVVKAPGVSGLRIDASDEPSGTTDASGVMVVPEVSSNVENRISIEQENLPIDYQITRVDAYISPPFRGGGVVRFQAQKLHAFTGRIFIVDAGKRTPAEYAGLEIHIPGQSVSTVIGQDGDFYLENIPPGTYEARVVLKRAVYSLALTIPQSPDTIIDLGELECRP